MKRKAMLCLLMGFVATLTHAQLLAPGEEASVLTKHRKELVSQAQKASEEVYEELSIKYHVPKEQKQCLAQLLTNREMRKLAYNYIYSGSTHNRVLSRLAIDSVYQDSIDLILIPFNSTISGENISYLLKAAKACELDESQHKHIEQQALDMAHQIRKNPRTNVWKQEMNVLRNTLTEKQLERFFSLKNGTKVGKKLKEEWARLTEAGLAAELDSVKDRAKAGRYYHLQQQIMDLYKYDNNTRKRHLAELSKQMPLWVKLIDAQDKQKRVDASKKTVSKDYAW